MECRFCKTELEHVVIDLLSAPASDSLLTKEQLNEPEAFYPLKTFVCQNCFLVQLDEYNRPGGISDSGPGYFSSDNKNSLKHASDYVDMISGRFGFNEDSLVMELASNDGYLLQFFLDKGVKVMGIEPRVNMAEVAIGKGIKTVIEPFTAELADRFANTWEVHADLLVGNNVLAQVPDIVDFVLGMKLILKEGGVITMEFPHVMQMVDNNRFNSISHEYYYYFSLNTVKQIFESTELEIFDVNKLSGNGGSIRVYAKHAEDNTKSISPSVDALLKKEMDKGLNTLEYYANLQQGALKIKLDLASFLIQQKRSGKKVAGYGATAGANGLLNYCGIKNDLIAFVVDDDPHKQDRFLPGSHIPVVNDAHLKREKPDHIIIFAWNRKDEIMASHSYIRDWGGKFVDPIPEFDAIG